MTTTRDHEDAVQAVEQSLAVLFRRARAVSANLAREVHPDLDASAYGILVRLATGEASTVTELAVALGIGKPTVSRQVTALEELGLLRREPNVDDRRASHLALTPDGAARLSTAREARLATFRTLLAAWPREDIVAFSRLLDRFNELTF